jgi:enamine deaminase RidA (YjgF/YER057c/UK114 family)
MPFASGNFRKVDRMRFLAALGWFACLWFTFGAGALIAPSQASPPLRPFSPSVAAGDFLYVSGQGAEDERGQIPKTPEAQIRQCLSNMKKVVEAAGLTMEHVVYVQVYLTDYADEGPLNKGWKEFFPTASPARSTIGVARLNRTPVEMSAVAVKLLSLKRPITPPGYPANAPLSAAVFTGNRLYLSGYLGRDINTGHIPEDPGAQVQLGLDRMRKTLRAVGADFRNMISITAYRTNKVTAEVMTRIYARNLEFGDPPAFTPIEVAGLPSGANIEFTGVAVMDIAKRRVVRPKTVEPNAAGSRCVLADDTLYCPATAGSIPGGDGAISAGSAETQLRQSMRNLLGSLDAAGMSFANVVSSTVYLDDIDDLAGINRPYVQYFDARYPARTAIQPAAPATRAPDAEGHWPSLEQVLIIAVK